MRTRINLPVPAPGRGTLRKLFRDIREALAGSDQDFTTGKLSRAIFLLSVPMVLEMILESVFAVVDIFFVSRLGADAVATVGLTESMITIIYAIATGLSAATASMVSRRIGEKNPRGASVVAVQAIFAGVLVSLLIAIPGAIYAGDLLKLMGASAAIHYQFSGFTAWMLGGNTVIMLLFINNAVFRSAGDPAVSMRVLWFANLINLALDPLLIFGIGPFEGFGVKGAAIATTTGRGLAVLLQFYFLFFGKKRVRIRLSDLRPDAGVMLRLIRIALGGIGQNLIITSSWIGLVRIISVFGSVAMAGYTIAIRIIIFALLPSWGLSNASATLVGQNLGARQPHRAERSVWAAARVNMILLAGVGVIMMLFSEPLIRLFIGDPGVIIAGGRGLRIVSAGFIAYGLGMVMVNSFNGAGDTTTPTVINLCCFWLLEIPLAWVLALPAGLNETGVFLAIVIAETAMALTAWWMFRKGKWKEKRV
jgi:putative MATE family efflux protein